MVHVGIRNVFVTTHGKELVYAKIPLPTFPSVLGISSQCYGWCICAASVLHLDRQRSINRHCMSYHYRLRFRCLFPSPLPCNSNLQFHDQVESVLTNISRRQQSSCQGLCTCIHEDAAIIRVPLSSGRSFVHSPFSIRLRATDIFSKLSSATTGHNSMDLKLCSERSRIHSVGKNGKEWLELSRNLSCKYIFPFPNSVLVQAFFVISSNLTLLSNGSL